MYEVALTEVTLLNGVHVPDFVNSVMMQNLWQIIFFWFSV